MPEEQRRYKIKTEDTSHWYDRDGNSRHTVPKKTSKTGEHKNTTLRDARELNLLPSVSEVNGIIANEGLVKWKLGQVAIAGARTQRQEGEDDETFADRIITESLSGVKDAAGFGTIMHSIIEDYLVHHHHPEFEGGDRMEEFWPGVKNWLDCNVARVIQNEYTVVSRAGYAGRVDIKVELCGDAHVDMAMSNADYGGECILDFKTRKPAPNGALLGYDKELWQLSAYSGADPGSVERGHLIPVANLYINSEVPGSLRFNAYTHDETTRGLEIFGHILSVWKLSKNYDPSF